MRRHEGPWSANGGGPPAPKTWWGVLCCLLLLWSREPETPRCW